MKTKSLHSLLLTVNHLVYISISPYHKRRFLYHCPVPLKKQWQEFPYYTTITPLFWGTYQSLGLLPRRSIYKAQFGWDPEKLRSYSCWMSSSKDHWQILKESCTLQLKNDMAPWHGYMLSWLVINVFWYQFSLHLAPGWRLPIKFCIPLDANSLLSSISP